MEAFVHRYRAYDTPVRCVHCGNPIVLVPEVGWVTLDDRDDCYDMCERDPYANHAPPGRTPPPGWRV